MRRIHWVSPKKVLNVIDFCTPLGLFLRYQEQFCTPEMFWGMDGHIVCLPLEVA